MIKLVTKKPKVSIYLPQDMKEALDGWAEEENRSVSNLVETLLKEAITARNLKKQSRGLYQQSTEEQEIEAAEAENIQELVRKNLSKLKAIGIKNLKAIANNEVLPTKADFIKIAAELDLDEKTQRYLWEKTFKFNGDNHATPTNRNS